MASSTDLRAQRIALAREDLPTFVEFVGRDEKTGGAITLAPLHLELFAFVAANPLAVIHSFIESGKSFLLSVMKTLFELGRNPSTRIIVCSSAHSQAVRAVRAVKHYIEQSLELHEVFPALRPGSLWRDDLLVVARPGISKDASVVATGVRGAVLGARADHIVLDDLDDRESTSSEHMRTETLGWVRSTLLSRLTDGGSVVIACTPWHPGDTSHRLVGEGWPLLKLAVTDEDGEPRWPERWSLERIKRARATMSMFEAARALDVDVRDDNSSWFKKEWIQTALDRGEARMPVRHLYSRGPATAYVGVDLAVSKSKRADKSAFAVVLHYDQGTPDGTPPEQQANGGDRELVYLKSARLDVNEIIAEIVGLWRWFQPVSIVVENVAAQDFVVQLLQKNTAIPVKGFRTGKGEMSLPYQVQALASEFARQKWIFRALDEVPGLAQELLYYAPSKHTPDRIAALAFARWGIEEGTDWVGGFPGFDLLHR